MGEMADYLVDGGYESMWAGEDEQCCRCQSDYGMVEVGMGQLFCEKCHRETHPHHYDPPQKEE